MIQENLVFNKKRDLHNVPQYGFVDLHEAYSSGIVPSDIDLPEQQYNDIDNPGNIVGKPSDIFEAYRMHDAIRSFSDNSQSSPEGKNDVE